MSELTPERERFIRHKVCQHELLSQSCNEELLAEIDRLRAALAVRDDLLKQTVTDQCDDESALEKLLTDRGFARQSNSDLVEPLVDFVERVLAARDDELRRLRDQCAKDDDEACQILGKALGYPWFKDDQKNFPGATEANGVCVADHVPATLAAEAARRIGEDADELRRLRGALKNVARTKTTRYGSLPMEDTTELCWCHCVSNRCIGEPQCVDAAAILTAKEAT